MDEVRAAGTQIVISHQEADGGQGVPWRLHLGGALTFFTSSGAALVLASASDPCRDVFRLDLALLEFLGLRGCTALLHGTRRFREHGGLLSIEHPRTPVRRVLRHGLVGAHNVRLG
ncbi:STAS domain-containing protein [Actinomycetospora cinnamomea]|uniref:STAS domain-containing protein n=1 Tax=Actinomycetospora cinnamomea TaxID=663609 RepID=UPI0010578865|nr:STAS domain-containing protein [Actinomycetospora cinnamomea]